MQPNATPTKRFDAVDYERFRDMVASDLFVAFVRRVAAELERAREVCERGDVEPEIRRAQGAVKALRTVLGLPTQMLSEMNPGK